MTIERAKRRLAAIVAADVAGYSRLMSADEEGTLTALNQHRAALIDPAIADHGGRIVKAMGDGLLLEFPSIVDAVRCSLAVQTGMAERNADVPLASRIDFRIGVNLGDVIAEGDDIFGDGVNIAARLEGIADPGGICISAAALQQVSGRLELATDDLGERALKNIEAPVHAFRIRSVTEVTATPKAAPALPAPPPVVTSMPERKPSLAVFPFRSLSADPDAGFIADGIALGIQTLLVQLPNLFFVNACLDQDYREGRATAAQAVADLPVRYALEGSAQQAGNRIRVSVQVSDLKTRSVIWAETFDRTLEDVFALQDEIARHIAGQLSIELIGGHLARDFIGGLEGPDDWEHFLRGIDHLYRWTKRDCAAAIPHFEALVASNPSNALGPCYLSLLHLYSANRNWAASKEEALAEAERWARVAIPLEDGNNGLGHSVLGAIALRERRHDESLELCRKGVAYRSSCPFAHWQLGMTQTYSGDPVSGIKHAREAMAVRILQPPPLVNSLAVAYRDHGDFDLSIPAAEEASRLDPHFSEALVTLSTDFALGGDATRAAETARQILAAEPDFTVSDYVRRQPYRDAATLERIADALAAAGLPR